MAITQDELRRRVQFARQQGFSPQEITRSIGSMSQSGQLRFGESQGFGAQAPQPPTSAPIARSIGTALRKVPVIGGLAGGVAEGVTGLLERGVRTAGGTIEGLARAASLQTDIGRQQAPMSAAEIQSILQQPGGREQIQQRLQQGLQTANRIRNQEAAFRGGQSFFGLSPEDAQTLAGQKGRGEMAELIGRRAAGLASLPLGAQAGLGAQVASGALAAAGEGGDVGDIAVGGGLGGALGLAGRGISSLAGRFPGRAAAEAVETIAPVTERAGRTTGILKGAGREFRGAVRGLEDVAGKDPFFTSSLDRLTGVADEFKLKGSARRQLSQAEGAFNDLTSEIRTNLKGSSGIRSSSDDILNRALNNLQESAAEFDSPSRDRAVDTFRKVLSKHSKNGQITPEGMFDAAQEIKQSKLGTAFNKAQPNQVESVYIELWKSLRNDLDNTVPGISNLTGKQRDLFQISAALTKKVNKAPIGAGAIRLDLPVVTPALQEVSDVVGRGLQAAGDIKAPRIPSIKAPEGLRESVSRATRDLPITPAAVSGIAAADRAPQEPATQVLGDTRQVGRFPGAPQVDRVDPAVQRIRDKQSRLEEFDQRSRVALQQATIAQLRGQPVDIERLQTLVERFRPPELTESEKKLLEPKVTKDLSVTERVTVGNIKSGLRNIDAIEDASRGELIRASLPGAVGARELDANITNLTDVIGRLRSGGAINADEEVRFRRLVPGPLDNEQSSAAKLDQLRILFSEILGPNIAR